MRIVIFGAGGVGGYFGARLAAAGNEVIFVARGAHLAAMRDRGLRIHSPLGDIDLPKVVVAGTSAGLRSIDFAFVTVKLWDTQEAAHDLLSLAQKGATIVSFQNGVQKDELFQKLLPVGSVMGGVSYISAAIQEPGIIRHFGPIQRLLFGEYDGFRSPRAEALHSACERAGILASISEDIEREIWEKFVFLVGLSGVTAAMRQPIGAIRENKQTRAFLLDVMREVVSVGQARGVALPQEYAEDRLTFCDTLPTSMTASMYHDLQRGNRLELPWLSGGVVEYGQRIGLPVPCNRAIADILALYVNGAPVP